jgi:hypothetical protein
MAFVWPPLQRLAEHAESPIDTSISTRRGNDRAPLPAFGSHRGSGEGMFGDVRVSIERTRLVHVPCMLRV